MEKGQIRAVPWAYIDLHQLVTGPFAMRAEMFRQDCHFGCVRKHLRAQPNKIPRAVKLPKLEV
jgi:hypothetical protein